MKNLKEISLYILGALITVGFFALLYLLVYKTIPAGNVDILNLVIGALIGNFAAVVGYFFGSSKGSADKTNMLNQKNGTIDRPEVYGCTDPKADNFNSSATIDDGSCTYLANPGNNG